MMIHNPLPLPVIARHCLTVWPMSVESENFNQLKRSVHHTWAQFVWGFGQIAIMISTLVTDKDAVMRSIALTALITTEFISIEPNEENHCLHETVEYVDGVWVCPYSVCGRIAYRRLITDSISELWNWFAGMSYSYRTPTRPSETEHFHSVVALRCHLTSSSTSTSIEICVINVKDMLRSISGRQCLWHGTAQTLRQSTNFRLTY